MRQLLISAAAVSGLLWVCPVSGQEEAKEKGQAVDPFAKWEPAMAEFEAADKKDPPAKGGILFVGSSSIRLWDTDKAFPELGVINRGFGGSTTAELNHFVGKIVTPYAARVIVVYEGDNDIAKGASPEQVAEDFNEFVRLARVGNAEVRIVFIAIKPSLARWKLWPTIQEANGLIAKVCEEDDRLVFADISKATLGEDGKPRPDYFKDDGLHLNAAGYEAWATVIAPLLAVE